MGETRNSFLDQILARRFAYEDGLEEEAVRRVRRPLLNARRDAIRVLNSTLGEIVDIETGRVPITPETRQAASATVQEINGLLDAGVDQATTELISIGERGFLQAAGDFVQASTASLSPDMASGIAGTFQQISGEALQVASQAPVLGISPQTALNRSLAAAKEVIRDELLQGIASGSSNQQIARRLRDSLDLTEVAAERITRTNMTAVYNDAHKMTIDANKDIFNGYRWMSVLDNVTSQICSNLHGKYFPSGSPTPGPPAHPNCRSILIGAFRDPEVQKIMDEDLVRARSFNADGTRAKDIFVPGDTSFNEWLARQPAITQNQVMGSKLRGEMFRRRLLKTDDLVDPLLRPVNNKEALRRAWAKNPKDKWLGTQARAAGLDAPISRKALAVEDVTKQGRAPWAKPLDKHPGTQNQFQAAIDASDDVIARDATHSTQTFRPGKDALKDRRVQRTLNELESVSKTRPLTSSEKELQIVSSSRESTQSLVFDSNNRLVSGTSYLTEEGSGVFIEHLGSLQGVGGSRALQRPLRDALDQGVRVEGQSTADAIAFYERLGVDFSKDERGLGFFTIRGEELATVLNNTTQIIVP